jgi:hypothetical protein
MWNWNANVRTPAVNAWTLHASDDASRSRRREALDFLGVGLELVVAPGQAREDGVGLPRDLDVDGAEAGLGGVHLPDLAAQRLGDQLAPQADADRGGAARRGRP